MNETQKPLPDRVCRLGDNCPTEGAVLQREWRQQRDTIATLSKIIETNGVKINLLEMSLLEAQAALRGLSFKDSKITYALERIRAALEGK
jgi:hypothetical protein